MKNKFIKAVASFTKQTAKFSLVTVSVITVTGLVLAAYPDSGPNGEDKMGLWGSMIKVVKKTINGTEKTKVFIDTGLTHVPSDKTFPTDDETAAMEVNGNIIANLPLANDHVATKAYVDAASGGGSGIGTSLTTAELMSVEIVPNSYSANELSWREANRYCREKGGTLPSAEEILHFGGNPTLTIPGGVEQMQHYWTRNYDNSGKVLIRQSGVGVLIGIEVFNDNQKYYAYCVRPTNGTSSGSTGSSQIGDATSGNSFVGLDSGKLTTGKNNTANGYQSLEKNTTGYLNTANGYQSLFSNKTGYVNTANGTQALYSNTTGYYNIANGSQALYKNEEGSANTANGIQSLYSNTKGVGNTANGIYSLLNNTEGNNNTANGMQSLYGNNTGNNNTADGYMAGALLSNNNGNTSSFNSLFLGANTKAEADSQTNQIVIGYGAVGAGSNSVVLGNTDITKTVLRGSVCIGDPAVAANCKTAWPSGGSGSSQIGDATSRNSFVGLNSGINNETGKGNTANGINSLYYNTKGNYNTANGVSALAKNTIGEFNVAIGVQALNQKEEGNSNIAVGYNAGSRINAGSDNTTSSNSLFLGANTKALEDGQTNQIVIGHGAVGAGDNSVVLGNDAITKTVLRGKVSAPEFCIGDATKPENCKTAWPSGGTGSSQIGDTTTSNSFVGLNSGIKNETGKGNTANGINSLYYNTKGNYNTANGVSALAKNTIGEFNVAIGVQALNQKEEGNSNIAVGYNAGSRINAGSDNTTSSNSLFLGANTKALEDGQTNQIVIGHGAVGAGSNSVVLGNTDITKTVLRGSVCIGDPAVPANCKTAWPSGGSGSSQIGDATSGNSFVGLDSGKSNTTGKYNTANGVNALASNTEGEGNTANGAWALIVNETGKYNTANGSTALFQNTEGDRNTADGHGALASNITGDNNIAMGYKAGTGIGAGIGDDANNNKNAINSVFLGANTKALADNQTNQIVIGNDAVGAGSNSVVLGNDDITKTVLRGSVCIGDATKPENCKTAWGGQWTVDADKNIVYSEGNAIINDVLIGKKTDQNSSHESIFFGNNALKSLDNSTIGNTAIGAFALAYNVSGAYNTAVGTGSLMSNKERGNTAIGYSAIALNVDGGNETAVGAEALTYSKGSGNTALGFRAGHKIATGLNNVFVGADAGMDSNQKIDAINSIAIGADAFTTKDNQVVLGNSAITETVLRGSVCIGDPAVPANCKTAWPSGGTGTSQWTVDADKNIVYSEGNAIINGVSVGYDDKSNIFFGNDMNISTGSSNIAFGRNALSNNTTGNHNVAFGGLRNNTEGYQNVSIGVNTLDSNTTGENNVGIGSVNTLIKNTTGNSNIAIGIHTLMNNTTGNSNVSISPSSLNYNTTGSNNIAIGQGALYNNNTGDKNVSMGDHSGVKNTEGEKNVFIGSYVNSLNNNDSNSIVIGANAIGAGSNSVVLGNEDITKTVLRGSVGIGTPTPTAKLDVNGTIRGAGITDSSDIRLKKDITNLNDDFAKVQKLQGVNYFWKDTKDKDTDKQIGLIAQEVEKVYPELVETDKSGMKSINYSHLVSPIIEAFKTLVSKFEALEESVKNLWASVNNQSEEIQALKTENAELKARLDKIEKMMQAK